LEAFEMASKRNQSIPGIGKKTALIYCRVSTKNQETEGTSLESQAEACAKHAESLGYSIARITKEVYSGAELWDRPQLARDRSELKAKQFQALVCYSTDRLSRDPIHLFILAEECARSNCELIFVTEPLDNSNEGQLIQYVRGYASRIEREKIKERSLRGKRAKLQSGRLLPSRKALYGYRNDSELGKRVVYEPEAQIVQQMFEWAVSGKGIIAIKSRLFEMNVFPPDGGRLPDGHARFWSTSTLQKILRDPAYKGETYAWQYCAVTPNKRSKRREKADYIRLPDGVTPPIVTPEIWGTVQARMDSNRGDFTRNQVRQYLLRGIAYCAVCGRKMYSDCSRGQRYYRCSSRMLELKVCGSVLTRAEKVEDQVWNQVTSILENPQIIADEVQRQQSIGPDPQLIEDRATAARRLAEIERVQQRLIRRLRETDDDDLAHLYEREIVQMKKEAGQIEAAIADIDARLQAQQKTVHDLAVLTEYCSRVSNRLSTFSFDEKRLAIEAIGARIQLNGDEWKLEARIPFEPSIDVGKNFASPTRTSILSGTPARNSKQNAKRC
jgi:site-specific DNA recombinase